MPVFFSILVNKINNCCMGFDIDAHFAELTSGDVVLSHKGNITGELISKVLEDVEARMDEQDENSKVRKKVYNVLVESLQNLYHHIEVLPDEMQSDFGDKYGLMVIARVDGRYRISTGNFIPAEKVDVLRNKIDKINSMSKDELKDMYKFILNHQRLSEKGGGGLGLVDIARKTGNMLDYLFEQYNDEFYFFNLNVFIEIA